LNAASCSAKARVGLKNRNVVSRTSLLKGLRCQSQLKAHTGIIRAFRSVSNGAPVRRHRGGAA
jgi:hypothetical protein